MPRLKLFHLPGACSRVTMTALEHLGLEYDDEIVDLLRGQQHSLEYRSVNPRGKVPSLLVDGELLAENAAILWWLHQIRPDGGLFPVAADHWTRAQQISDLFWLSAGWHPAVRAIRMPIRWTNGDTAPVKEKGRQLLESPMAQLNSRLERHDWWYGQEWAIIDVYFYWNYATASKEDGFPLADYPSVLAHCERVEAHPAFQKALERENRSLERGRP
jgi:glutathione S-transferase